MTPYFRKKCSVKSVVLLNVMYPAYFSSYVREEWTVGDNNHGNINNRNNRDDIGKDRPVYSVYFVPSSVLSTMEVSSFILT